MKVHFITYPWFFLVAVANMVAIANIPRCLVKGRDGWAFLSSVASMCLLVALYAIGTFPTILRSSVRPEELSLTISNSYASAATLKILLIIVCIGIPLALAYLTSVYYIFRGKVKLDSYSY